MFQSKRLYLAPEARRSPGHNQKLEELLLEGLIIHTSASSDLGSNCVLLAKWCLNKVPNLHELIAFDGSAVISVDLIENDLAKISFAIRLGGERLIEG